MGRMQSPPERFGVGETSAERFARRATDQCIAVASCALAPPSFRGARSSRANPESREEARPTSGFRVCAQQGASRNDVFQAGCDKVAPVACLMLHLRSRYVSKAAIFTVPVLLALVENRSPA
jgi:hypothetical protein